MTYFGGGLYRSVFTATAAGPAAEVEATIDGAPAMTRIAHPTITVTAP